MESQSSLVTSHHLLSEQLHSYYTNLKIPIPEKIAEFRAEVEQFTFQVMVLGGIKSGKSTFINKLVGSNVLATDGSIRTECRWVVSMGSELSERGNCFIKVHSLIPSQEEEEKKDGELEFATFGEKEEVTNFQNLEVLADFVGKEFTEEKMKKLYKNEMKVLNKVEVGINKPTTNCKVMQFVEFPGFSNDENFSINKVTMQLRNYIEKFNGMLFISLAEDFPFENFQELWEMINTSQQEVGVVITNVHEYLRRLDEGDEKKGFKNLNKLKNFIKPIVKEKEESRVDKINKKLKEVTNELGKHIQNFSIYIYDQESNAYTPFYYYNDNFNSISEERLSDSSYLIQEGLSHVLQFIDQRIVAQKKEVVKVSSQKIRLLSKSTYEHLVVQHAVTPEMKDSLQKVENEVSKLQGEFAVKFEFYMHRFFDQELPGEIKRHVATFIHEDKQGKQGKAWRINSQNFKKELNAYLYKCIRKSFEKNILQVQVEYLREFKGAFEAAVLKELNIDCQQWFLVHAQELEGINLNEIGISNLTFILGTVLRNVILGMFFVFFVVFFLLTPIFMAAWTRKGQAEDVEKKILQEISKPKYRNQIIEVFKEFLDRKGAQLKSILDHILYEGLTDEQVRAAFVDKIKDLDFDVIKEQRDLLEQAIKEWTLSETPP